MERLSEHDCEGKIPHNMSNCTTQQSRRGLNYIGSNQGLSNLCGLSNCLKRLMHGATEFNVSHQGQ